ncbi:MAG: dinitrogenase iron-molybdenum cofactor biosynthesis protein [Acidobacteria bacterium]|nr:MAG: dinitrogenase iron-molybdenum cofactor biosynthesis protein [Acidobacteriota bacterium]
MKICVTASSEGLNAPMDSRFARAPFMVIVDSETGEAETTANEAVSAGHGAGTQAAQTVSRLGAEILLTAHCGPKAFEVLAAAKVKVFGIGGGTVAEAVDAWKAGKLEEMENSDSSAGWAG